MIQGDGNSAGGGGIIARAGLNGSVWNWWTLFCYLPVSPSFIFILISCLSTCVLPSLFLCSVPTSSFCPPLNRPETRLEQAESQWQWHGQRPDSGWVQTSIWDYVTSQSKSKVCDTVTSDVFLNFYWIFNGATKWEVKYLPNTSCRRKTILKVENIFH